MRGRFAALCLLFLLTPFCGAASTDSGEQGFFSEQLLDAIPEGTGDVSYTLSFQSLVSSTRVFRVAHASSKTLGALPEGTYDSYYALPSQVVTFKALEKKAISFTLKRKYIAEGNNDLFIHDTYQGCDYTIGATIGLLHPQNWTISSESGILRRSTITSGYFCLQKTLAGTNLCYETLFEGCPSNLVNPAFNRLPLEQIVLRNRAQADTAVPFLCSKATLYLYNQIDAFPVGVGTFHLKSGKAWREFPLALVQGSEGGYARHLQLSKDYAVSLDGRMMANQIRDGDVNLIYSRKLYLPPLKNGQTALYDFEIRLEGCGEGGLATISYPFSVEKNAEYVGSCLDSRWCVEVSHA